MYWTNLGLLYLHYDDSGLANQALYKAQVLNPEYSLAWVGQAFVAIANGHLPEAKAVLEHAITLPVPIASVYLTTLCSGTNLLLNSHKQSMNMHIAYS